MVTMPMSSLTCVRPAWGSDAPPLSARAVECLVREWRALGLLGPDDDEESDVELVLRGVQERAAGATVMDRAGKPHLKLVTAADAGGANVEVREAEWPTFEGCLLKYGETATIGKDSSGHYVTEKFRQGAISMPNHDVPLVNRGHERSRIAGHLTSVHTDGDAVMVRGVLVDSVRDGFEAMELARAGSVRSLSIEFMPMGAPFTTITREAGGGQLVTHSKVTLVGVGLVAQPAYRSARVTRLLDRKESGRQTAAYRAQARAHLEEIGRSGPTREQLEVYRSGLTATPRK